MPLPSITIVGAGPVGALLATFLSKHSVDVTVVEARPDPRITGYAGGRSINFTLTERGLHALDHVNLRESALQLAVKMRGRMVHPPKAQPEFHPYGHAQSAALWSINRAELTALLLGAAERAGAHIHFDQRISDVAFLPHSVRLNGWRGEKGEVVEYETPFVIGADGAGSKIRAAMNEVSPLGQDIDKLHYGYKELHLPAAELGRFQLDSSALHVWPRGEYLCTALPNPVGSFTVILFLPKQGGSSFESIRRGADIRAFFDREFADLSPLLPDLETEFFTNPTGSLATLHLKKWHIDHRAVLIGDSAHAIVPFHGQGMNCGFEDVVELTDALTTAPSVEDAFATFENRRLPNAEAIGAMSLDNFVELRSRVSEPAFLLRQQLQDLLIERHPDRFLSRYELASFTRVPYAQALCRGAVQDHVLRELTARIRSLSEVDLHEADRLVVTSLTPLAEIEPQQ